MTENAKCPKCKATSFIWETVPYRQAVEKAIRNGKEPKGRSAASDPSILYCMKCGHIIKVKYSSLHNTPHGSPVVIT